MQGACVFESLVTQICKVLALNRAVSIVSKVVAEMQFVTLQLDHGTADGRPPFQQHHLEVLEHDSLLGKHACVTL